MQLWKRSCFDKKTIELQRNHWCGSDRPEDTFSKASPQENLSKGERESIKRQIARWTTAMNDGKTERNYGYRNAKLMSLQCIRYLDKAVSGHNPPSADTTFNLYSRNVYASGKFTFELEMWCCGDHWLVSRKSDSFRNARFVHKAIIKHREMYSRRGYGKGS